MDGNPILQLAESKGFANCRSVKRPKIIYKILCKTLQKKVHKINEKFYDFTYSAKRPSVGLL